MSTLTAEQRHALQSYVAAPATRRALTAYVRRRGLSSAADADDVVQTVLCDALAVQATPEDPSELPRWLTGIARRKVADEHRRRARWSTAEPPEQATSHRPELDDLLRRIQTDLIDAEQRRSLQWMLREHAGESLNEIATEQAVAPATLRQRICRLRRHLRARYVGPLALLLGLGGAAALAVMTPSQPALRVPVSVHQPLRGTWRVVDGSRKDLLPLELRVVIDEHGARIEDSKGQIEIGLGLSDVTAHGAVVSYGDGTWRVHVDSSDANHLRLASSSGYVSLERLR